MLHRARSLRLKVTLWFFLVFSALQLGLVGAVLFLRRDEVRRSFEDELERSANAMVENLLVNPEWTGEKLAELVPAEADFELSAVRDAEGKILASHGVLDPKALPFTTRETIPGGPVGDVITELLPEAAEGLIGRRDSLHLVTAPFRFRGDSYFFQAAVDEGPFPLHFRPFSDLLFVGVPVGMVAALLAAWMIAGRAVAPILKLSRAARSVNPKSLGERIRIETSDDEVSVLQAELNHALERLERGYRSQEEFISNVSHELKTPLAVLLTESQVLRMGAPSLERHGEFVGRVEEEMQRLGALVETFLTLTRADLARGYPLAERVPVNDVLVDAVQHLGALAERSGVRLVPQLIPPGDSGPDPEVRGDAHLLRTMLDNLIRNAIRHSPEGSNVDVSATRSNGEARLTVRDHGPGIPPEFLRNIFDRFVRIPSTEEEESGIIQGTGLGLAIARSIVELHRGRISASNHPEGGASFEIRLPLGRAPG